ncbi:MAG TPA: phosphatidate cytidylyltransferase [Balneolaceae bacterium]|nr:phosphatidate cytidylyltransferase [Balneolaceae bacterium]
MNEAIVRIFSGAIYAALLLLSILSSEYTFTILVFIFGLFTLFELQKLLDLKSYLAYFILVVFMVVFKFFHLTEFGYILLILMFLTLIVNLLLIRDLLAIRKIPLFEGRKYLLVIFYLISALVFLTLIPYQNPTGRYNPDILIGIFALIWTNDSFAYLIGKTFGRRKLFERISPNKTIEGFIGGLVATIIAGGIVCYYSHTFSYKVWIGLALITGVFGTFGDLIQSKLKRQAGVKDSGSLMPGHGGLLDRLDSIIFAATFIYSFLVIVNHVS